MADIIGCCIHYTASFPGVSVHDVAAYQVSAGAAEQTGADPIQPFPGIAYTLVIDGQGKVNLCHDLETRCWHNAAQSQNRTHVGICWIGNTNPTEDQMNGLARACVWVEKRLGRQLVLAGHQDTFSTSCPGHGWPQWRSELAARIAALR